MKHPAGFSLPHAIRPIRVALPAGHHLDDPIPNSYRVQYYGTPDAPSAEADTDQDSMTTLQEYVFGTDPTDSTSRLRLLSDMTLDPPTPSDRLVAWESTTDLVHSSWTSSAPDPASVTDLLFYRALITLP